MVDLDASGNWARIIWYDQMAWVSTHYLAPDNPPTIAGTALPEGLSCGGTEPFWDVTLRSSGAQYSDPVTDPVTLGFQSAMAPAGRTGFPVMLTYAGSGGSVQSIIRPLICNDGMSDREFGLSADIVLQTATGTALYSGCCALR